MTQKSAFGLVWLLLGIFATSTGKARIFAMGTRPVRILHDCKWHDISTSKQSAIAPPFVASSTLCGFPVGVSLATDVTRTMRLQPRLWLLLDRLLDSAFIVDDYVFLTLLVIRLGLCDIGEGAALELFSAHLGKSFMRKVSTGFDQGRSELCRIASVQIDELYTPRLVLSTLST
jgi:hypothetical protein